MAFSNNENKQMDKDLRNNGWTKDKNGDGYSKGNQSAKQSDSGGSWNINGHNYTRPSDAKNSGRM